jgi:chromate transporter
MSHDTSSPPPQKTGQIAFNEVLRFWLKLGFIGFGGPTGQIAIMYQELVEKKRWISEKRFLHALNYCMVLPGPEAQQLATYIGWLMHRTWGGVIAGVLFVLPSLFILIVLSWCYIRFGHLSIVQGIFFGIKPAVVAIVLHAAYRIGSRTLKNKLLWLVAISSFVAIFVWNTPFPLIVIGAAVFAVGAAKLWPALFHHNQHSAKKSYGVAVMDDDTPTPAHARFKWSRLLIVMVSGVLLWILPMTILIISVGWQHMFTQMAWFFTKAALLTFGGAYAVLPYVYQGAVTHYGWVSASQMIDGLALGETTPGPLIMVVAFVGFIGGYTQALFGSDQLFMAGALAACLVTWFTFLPSFIFILVGGPLVESTHNELVFTAPLTAITAAVVGVIVNLALFFAYHVFWPAGWAGSFSWVSAAIAVGAAIALFKFKISVMNVIIACGVIGLAARTLL